MHFSSHSSTIAHLFGYAIVATMTIKLIEFKKLMIKINDKQSPFNALLEKDGPISVHKRNFKILATKMLKVSTNLAPSQMHEIFI